MKWIWNRGGQSGICENFKKTRGFESTSIISPVLTRSWKKTTASPLTDQICKKLLSFCNVIIFNTDLGTYEQKEQALWEMAPSKFWLRQFSFKDAEIDPYDSFHTITKASDSLSAIDSRVFCSMLLLAKTLIDQILNVNLRSRRDRLLFRRDRLWSRRDRLLFRRDRFLSQSWSRRPFFTGWRSRVGLIWTLMTRQWNWKCYLNINA